MIVEEIEEEPEPINDQGELLNDQAMDPDEWDLDEFEAISGMDALVSRFFFEKRIHSTQESGVFICGG